MADSSFDAIISDPPYGCAEVYRSDTSDELMNMKSTSKRLDAMDKDGRQGGKEGGREGGRERDRERGRERGREGSKALQTLILLAERTLKPGGRLVFFLPLKTPPLPRLSLPLSLESTSPLHLHGNLPEPFTIFSETSQTSHSKALPPTSTHSKALKKIIKSKKKRRKGGYRGDEGYRREGEGEAHHSGPSFDGMEGNRLQTAEKEVGAPEARLLTDLADLTGSYEIDQMVRRLFEQHRVDTGSIEIEIENKRVLRLCSIHRQILSPSFSRYLCVVEKRTDITDMIFDVARPP